MFGDIGISGKMRSLIVLLFFFVNFLIPHPILSLVQSKQLNQFNHLLQFNPPSNLFNLLQPIVSPVPITMLQRTLIRAPRVASSILSTTSRPCTIPSTRILTSASSISSRRNYHEKDKFFCSTPPQLRSGFFAFQTLH